jgi:DNA polymerase-1
VESLDTNYHDGKILGLAISNEKGNFYLDFFSEKQTNVLSILGLKETEIDFALQAFLASAANKNTYDLKRSVKLLENAGYQVNFDSFTYDMMSVGYLLNAVISSTFQNHLRLLDADLNLENDEAFYGKGVKQTGNLPVEKKAQFIGKKAYYLMKTKELGIAKLKENDQLTLYQEIDFPLIKVLKSMEDEGVLIDRDELIKQTKNAELKIQQIVKDVKNLLGDLISDDFNLASPKQVKELLYDQLQLPNTLKGSTSREALELLAKEHPIVNYLLEYRKWSKLYSTYLSGFEKYIHQNNRVYTIYNQNLTATGRLSSIEPNLQNISVRDEEQKDVRKIFITDSDFV